MRNVHVGQFRIEGLKPVAGPNPVLCRMRLDLDGILHVTAIEKETGLSKHVVDQRRHPPRDAAEIARGREELDRLFARRGAGRGRGRARTREGELHRSFGPPGAEPEPRSTRPPAPPPLPA